MMIDIDDDDDDHLHCILYHGIGNSARPRFTTPEQAIKVREVFVGHSGQWTSHDKKWRFYRFDLSHRAIGSMVLVNMLT